MQTGDDDLFFANYLFYDQYLTKSEDWKIRLQHPVRDTYLPDEMVEQALDPVCWLRSALSNKGTPHAADTKTQNTQYTELMIRPLLLKTGNVVLKIPLVGDEIFQWPLRVRNASN